MKFSVHVVVLASLALGLLVFLQQGSPSAGAGSVTFVCRPQDLAGRSLINSSSTTELFCRYQAVPNDFFCKYFLDTGLLKQDHDDGFCPPVASIGDFVTNTPTNTPTRTLTNTPTNTPTPTDTATPTNSPTNTRIPTDTPTPTNTPTPSNTPTNTSTPTSTPSGPKPDLVIVSAFVEGSPGPFHAGDTITVSQTVRNTGVAIPTGTTVRLSDRLPAGASVPGGLAGVLEPTSGCTVTLPDVFCDYNGLGIGQEVTMRVKVQLPSRIPGGGVVTIQKDVDPQNKIAESNEYNNKVQLTIPMQ